MYDMSITLAGTLMNKNIPLANFSIANDVPQSFQALCEEQWQWPFEMRFEQDGYTLVEALKVRMVTATRQRLFEDIEEAGLDIKCASDLLRYQNASSVDDPYWVRFDGEGPQSWEELRKKIGFTVW